MFMCMLDMELTIRHRADAGSTKDRAEQSVSGMWNGALHFDRSLHRLSDEVSLHVVSCSVAYEIDQVVKLDDCSLEQKINGLG